MSNNHISTSKFYISPTPAKQNNGINNNNNNNGVSNIPLRRQLNRTNSNCSNSSSSSSSKLPINNNNNNNNNANLVEKWREKFESTEQKRKSMLIEKEKTVRQNNELQKKYNDLQVKHDQLETELFETNENLTKLRLASEMLFKEYEKLKNQYEAETGAMARALKDASQWYQENKQLKLRNSIYFNATTNCQECQHDTVDEGVDATSDEETSSNSDIENLNKTIKQLSSDVAELQTELDSVKHTEFQTNEENVRLNEDLENEREANKQLELKINDLEKNYDQIIRVSDMFKKEIDELKKSEEEQRSVATALRREAETYKKERNVLKHQSTLLMQGLNNDNNDEYLNLLQEIEQLKRTLEDERVRYEEEIAMLQEKIEELENNQQVEVLEERLKLAEAELQAALQRAEKAEEAVKTAPPPPPVVAPPPPPPPPPPMAANQPPVVPLRVKRKSRVVNLMEQVADTIGVDSSSSSGSKAQPPGVNEDVINAIKLGNFTLRKAKNGDKKEGRDGTKAVSELLNILGNLRRTPKKRQSVIAADVQL